MMKTNGNGRPRRRRIVKGEAFVLLDEAGQERATLTVDENNETLFVLGDADHNARFRVRVRNDGSAAISLSDDQGLRIIVALGQEGSSVVTLADALTRKPRVGMQVKADGTEALVTACAPDGGIIATLPPSSPLPRHGGEASGRDSDSLSTGEVPGFGPAGRGCCTARLAEGRTQQPRDMGGDGRYGLTRSVQLDFIRMENLGIFCKIRARISLADPL